MQLGKWLPVNSQQQITSPQWNICIGLKIYLCQSCVSDILVYKPFYSPRCPHIPRDVISPRESFMKRHVEQCYFLFALKPDSFYARTKFILYYLLNSYIKYTNQQTRFAKNKTKTILVSNVFELVIICESTNYCEITGIWLIQQKKIYNLWCNGPIKILVLMSSSHFLFLIDT